MGAGQVNVTYAGLACGGEGAEFSLSWGTTPSTGSVTLAPSITAVPNTTKGDLVFSVGSQSFIYPKCRKYSFICL